MRISDWSSDVCSSDLNSAEDAVADFHRLVVLVDGDHFEAVLAVGQQFAVIGVAVPGEVVNALGGIDRFMEDEAARGIEDAQRRRFRLFRDRKSTRLNSSH